MGFKRSAPRVALGLAAFAGAGMLGAWLATVLFGDVGGNRAARLDRTSDAELINQGSYVAVLGDCAACHTGPGGKPFAGGLPIATPIGTVYTTNITPDAKTGIGRYSLGDFERAVRRGVRPDSTSLYPAMPYPSYARMSEADIKALYAYFMGAVEPVAQPNRDADIAWPLSMRWPLTYWRWAFAPAVAEHAAALNGDPVLDRGAYLVEGPGHCGSCHTPRGLSLQEKALTAKDGQDYLSGGLIDHYVASNLRGDALTGLGNWSEDDIVALLQTGRTSDVAAFGGMADVVTHSTQLMRDEDLRAIARYLKSLPASGRETGFAYDATAATELAAGTVSARGALDYLNNCAACHRSSGRGYAETFPTLAGNPAVNGGDPSSLIAIVLNGGAMPGTAKAPTRFAMPPFADRLTDQEVADVVTFIRSSWGNKGSPVTPREVERLRTATRPKIAQPR